jgi:hypothetical protein
LNRWHRYLGLTVILFVILLSVTGILLNHTEELQLDKRYVQSEWILNWYGIQTPKIDAAFLLETKNGKSWLSAINHKLYINQTIIVGDYDNLRGAVAMSDGFIVVLVGEKILLLMPNGELVEELSPLQGLPVGITALGLTEKQQLQVQTANGLYQPDNEFLNWEKLPNNTKPNQVRWILPQSLPEKFRQTITTQVYTQILPIERLLLDLHSGRLLSVYLMDAVAILFIILAITGFFLWLRRWRRNLIN